MNCQVKCEANKMISGYLTEAEAASTLARTTRTLRIWRSKGLGPAFSKVGRNVVYRGDAIREWLMSNEVQPVRSKKR